MSIRKETINLGQRFTITMVGSLFITFVGAALPVWLSLTIGIVLSVALFSVRRTVVVDGGEAKLGYGVFVPFWWSTIAARGVGEVGLVSRVVSSGENGKRTVVDLTLGRPPASTKVWRAPFSKAAEARRLGEQLAAALSVPFRDLVSGNGVRPPEALDLSLRERVRRHGYQRQTLAPPPGLDFRREANEVVMRFPHRWVRHHFIYLLVPLGISPTVFLAIDAVQRDRYEQLVFVPPILLLFAACMVLLVVSIGTEELPVRRIHLTPSKVTMVRRFFAIPLRKTASLAAIEDVNVVQHGAIAGCMAIASDEAVLVADRDMPHRDFVTAYVAQWVAFGGE